MGGRRNVAAPIRGYGMDGEEEGQEGMVLEGRGTGPLENGRCCMERTAATGIEGLDQKNGTRRGGT